MKKYIYLIFTIVSFIFTFHFGKNVFGGDLFETVGSFFLSILLLIVSIILSIATWAYFGEDKQVKNIEKNDKGIKQNETKNAPCIPQENNTSSFPRIARDQIFHPKVLSVEEAEAAVAKENKYIKMTESNISAKGNKTKMTFDENVNIHFPETFEKGNKKYYFKHAYENVLIVGYKFRHPIKDLIIGEDICLEIEADNENDNTAIKVSVFREYGKHHIGYISKKNHLKGMVYDYLIADKCVLAKLSSNDTENLLMDIVFYDLTIINSYDYFSIKKNSYDYFSIKKNNKPVANFTSTIYDDGAQRVEIGNKVNFLYDYDERTENIVLMFNFESMPIENQTVTTRVKNIINNLGYPVAFVDQVEKLEYSKYRFKIAIYNLNS